MVWALLIFIFSVLLQAGAGYAVGDIVSHALSYDLTRKTAIWEGLLILVLLLLKTWLEYHFAPEKKNRPAFALPESVIWFVGTVVLGVTLELYTDMGIPVQVVSMLLFLFCSLIFERETYLQFLRVAEDAEEEPAEEEEDAYAFAVDRKEDAGEKKRETPDVQAKTVNAAGVAATSTQTTAQGTATTAATSKKTATPGTVAAAAAAATKGAATVAATTAVTDDGNASASKKDVAADNKRMSGINGPGIQDSSEPVVSKETCTGTYHPATPAMSAFYIAARVIAYVAAILIGILALTTVHDTENRVRAYIIMLVGAIVTVIFRLLPAEPGEEREDEEDEDVDIAAGSEVEDGHPVAVSEVEEDHRATASGAGREKPAGSGRKQEQLSDAALEAMAEEKLQRRRIIYAVVSLLITVFLCTRSVLVGLIFLLDAFLIGVIIPMATYRYAIGGTEVVEKKTDALSRITSRVLMTVILVISAWLLSYGALWEYEFLIILGTVYAAQELLIRQNFS